MGCLVPLGRLERPTRGLGNRCSIQLSYRGMVEIGGFEPPDLCDASAALSQLSYIPKFNSSNTQIVGQASCSLLLSDNTAILNESYDL